MPEVEFTRANQLDPADPIFTSLSGEYADFSPWIKKCQRENRPSWVIRDSQTRKLDAVCIMKPYDDDLLLNGPTAKICTLKVGEPYRGHGYGKRLLETVLGYLARDGFRYAYVTVLENHTDLITMVEEFGFDRLRKRSPLGERVYLLELDSD